MPNLLDVSGLQIKTLDEIVEDLKIQYRLIYGNDIVLDSNTPDGQLINVFAQQILDNLELQQQVYTSFDPDQAIGRTLDMRAALNGLRRQAGSYTLQEVQVTVDRARTLPGLDAAVNDPDGTGYTVSDNTGNQFILTNTYNAPGAGTYTLTFRSQKLGAVLTTPNTITTPVTLLPGVLSVNNPNPALSIGQNEEQDGAFKIRRRQSVAISSKGFADAIEANVRNVPGVTYARTYENNTAGTDADGTPPHATWTIVEGGDYDAIARAIYAKRSGGSPMRGAISRTVTRTNGLPLVVSFDVVATARLYASMYVNAISGNLLTTGNTTNGSPIVTNIPSTIGLQAGYPIRGTGIPAGAVIGSVDSPTQIHLANAAGVALNATATGVAVALTVVPISAAVVRAAVAANLNPTIYQTVDINQIASIVKAQVPNALVTFPSGTGFSSDGVTYVYQLTPAARNLQFTLTAADVGVL